jgi:hypothetical protein
MATPPGDAAVIAAKPPRAAPKPPPPDPDESGDDETVARQLAQAETAFRGANYDLAEKLTNGIINASDARANPRQMARAYAIRGAVQCAARNDEGRAMQNLRNIPGRFRALRQLVLTTCHSNGFLQGVR